jgi:hypothetical protein
MYQSLKDTARAMQNFCKEIEQEIDNKVLTADMIEQYFHELEVGDYSLMSALHEAWHEAKEANKTTTKTPTNTGDTAQ